MWSTLIWLRENSSNIINYDQISSQIGEVKGELMHENRFEFEALSMSCYFDDVISVLNKNMKHARAIEFMFIV